MSSPSFSPPGGFRASLSAYRLSLSSLVSRAVASIAAPAAPAAVVTAPPTHGASPLLGALMEKIPGLAERARLNREAAEIRKEIATLETQIAAGRAKLADVNQTLRTTAGAFGLQLADLDGKSSAQIQTALTARIRVLASEQVEGLGFPSSSAEAN